MIEGYVARQIDRYERGIAQAQEDERRRICQIIAGFELADCTCDATDILLHGYHMSDCRFDWEAEWRVAILKAIATPSGEVESVPGSTVPEVAADLEASRQPSRQAAI